MGYFELITQADVFIFLDTVQFEKQSWQSRNRIRSRSGQITWLTVPTKKVPLETTIAEIEISPNPVTWRKKHERTIRESLSRYPHFSEIEPLCDTFFSSDETNLSSMNKFFITSVSELLRIDVEFRSASEITCLGRREELLVNLCKEFGADRYYSNAGSKIYLEEKRGRFEDGGISLQYQNWEHPVYSQMGEGFISHLTVLDSLSAIGIENVRKELGLA